MPSLNTKPLQVFIVAIPETAGSALYGLKDVLMATGNIWQTLSRNGVKTSPFAVSIVSPGLKQFFCGNNIPVLPDEDFHQPSTLPDILILPEIWLGPDEPFTGRYPTLVQWIKQQYEAGVYIYSACSGAVMLAETGLLDECQATSHWGYQDLFRKHYPKVRFKPEPNLVIADSAGKIVTAGGTTSWHDLAIYIISKHVSPAEAVRIAQVYLLKWHDEGQLPYHSLLRNNRHSDHLVAECEEALKRHYKNSHAIQLTLDQANIPSRTLKRRFKNATGSTLIDYLQNVRIEAAKRLLEQTQLPVDEISIDTGYEDASFFRRLFKRRTGLSPSQYRRMFKPIIHSAEPDSMS
ncbi:helix-turn-helix domain-containing protein [Methylophaga sp.]|uniref:GlxA family transcriptional regulator n=1 Tax=Methylophaga sp. TaxID=2024840 RepID=UPI0013FEE875|nr:helix-turn-helix domain-containing protein [Methylophaga sp.]MTI63614.1 helix-turn-helix domain-containing protein [Methylophaga sp.]